jgi:hypothetical protein
LKWNELKLKCAGNRGFRNARWDSESRAREFACSRAPAFAPARLLGFAMGV